MTGTIDLHMHSTASDGTDTPEQLLKNVRRAGLRVFSLTDHDAIDGCARLEPLVPADLVFFRGVEFSCITPAGKCHILGYQYRPGAPSMDRALEAGRALRLAKLTRRLDYLRTASGIVFSPGELDWLHSLSSPGKPHLAQLIVQQGKAADRTEAIRRYLDGIPGGDARIEARLAIEGILGAGGVPVWAHPLGGEGETHLTPEDFAAQFAVLRDLGIQGIECCYSRYTAAEVSFLLDQARKHGLLVSGGSDYHGTAKTIPLGTLNAYGQPVDPTDLTIVARLMKEKE